MCIRDSVSIIHTDEKIDSDDEPTKAIRKKKNSSMVLAAKAVKDGEADAVLSAGNTGALLAAGFFIVGRIKNIDRPGLMSTLPKMCIRDRWSASLLGKLCSEGKAVSL